MLQNSRLLAKAFRRTSLTSTTITRQLSGSASRSEEEGKAKGVGSTSADHVTRTTDTHNVEIDASKAGEAAREKGGEDGATSERDVNRSNEKTQQDYPEAPRPVVGMNDERGSVSVARTLMGIRREDREYED